MRTVQEIINRIRNNDFNDQDLEQFLDSSLVLVKVNAILAVLKGNLTEEKIIYKLSCISQNIHHEPKVLGEWTTGHYAMAVLYLLDTKKTQKIYNETLKELDECTIESIIKLIEQIPNCFDIY